MTTLREASDKRATRTTEHLNCTEALVADCPHSRAALYPRSLIIATPHLISQSIKRPTVTLLISLNGREFNVAVPGVGRTSALAAFIRAGEERRLQAANCDLLSINIEPGHALFRSLQRALRVRSLQTLPVVGPHAVPDLLRRSFEADVPAEPHVEALVELSARAGLAVDRSLRPGDRMNDMIAAIDGSISEPVPLSQLANRACLSESRLSHLFVEEIGVPLRTYLLWRRHRLALSLLPSRTTLAQLASETGFADSAHLTRTFVGYLGFPPRHIDGSCFIQDLAQG